jgi:hypothetical protein
MDPGGEPGRPRRVRHVLICHRENAERDSTIHSIATEYMCLHLAWGTISRVDGLGQHILEKHRACNECIEVVSDWGR